MGGWLDSDNKAISVQLNLTGTATGTELGNYDYRSNSKLCQEFSANLSNLLNIKPK